MGMRGLRYIFRSCGAGLLLAVAVPMAFAAADHVPSSGAPKKADTSSAAHPHSSSAKSHRHTAKPAAHQTASHKEHKKDLASRPTTGSPAGAADKSLDQRPALGPFSLGLETEQNVKRRSIRGGEYDPERDGDQSKGVLPPYVGF